MTAGGLLHGPTLVVVERTFQTGDRVVPRHNDPHQRDPNGETVTVDNGMTATITSIAQDGDVTVVLTASRRPIVLDRASMRAAWVDHGYAITIHAAQGARHDGAVVDELGHRTSAEGSERQQSVKSPPILRYPASSSELSAHDM